MDKIYKPIIYLLIISILLLGLYNIYSTQQLLNNYLNTPSINQKQTNKISVSGESSKENYPDQITIHLSIKTNNNSASISLSLSKILVNMNAQICVTSCASLM